MGAQYMLTCLDHGKDAPNTVEFSVVGYVSLKHPDEAGQALVEWAQFIADHNGCRLGLRDHHGQLSHPAEMNGAKFFGLQGEQQGGV